MQTKLIYSKTKAYKCDSCVSQSSILTKHKQIYSGVKP